MGFSPSSRNVIHPVERIYRELSQPRSRKPAPKAPDPPAPIGLEHSEVLDILKNKRGASIAELEWILRNAKPFRLSPKQQNEISMRATIAHAKRDRRGANPNADLFAQLDIAETPVGLLHHRSWFERELRAGINAIASCKLHRPQRCECCRAVRERLWLVQDRYGAKSPEGWAATRTWEALNELEDSIRPER